jgi:hypothetical protein
MTTIHYSGAVAPADTTEVIAAFPNVQSARRALMALRTLPVEADLIPVPGDTTDRGSATITGALIGAVWGILLAALFINFVAIDITTTGVALITLFGTVGGMAIGGFLAASLKGEKAEGYRSPPPAEDSARAFVMVRAPADTVEPVCQELQASHPIDIHRSE